MKANYVIAAVLVFILALFGAGVYAYNSYKQNEMAKELDSLLIREHSYISGDKNAKVTIVEFFDPMCAACVKISPVVAKLPEKYHGQIRIVYRALAYHKDSDIVLSLLEAAKNQGKFEETMAAFNTYFRSWYANEQLNIYAAWGILEQVGIDTKIARVFLDENQNLINEQLEQNKEDALKLNITGTPTFFINQKIVKSSDITKEVEALLAYE
jgi:protein-disulfide isomerase